MEHQRELAAANRSLRSYYDAVAGGDAAAAARCFAAPAMFMTPQGGGTAETTARVETSFAAMLRDLKTQGYSHSAWSESHIKLLGGDSTALASLIVVRHRTDATEIGTFGFTYVLRKIEGEWKIAVLIGHPPDDVLRVD